MAVVLILSVAFTVFFLYHRQQKNRLEMDGERVSVDKPILCPPSTAPSCSSPARAAAEAPALVRGSGLPHCPPPQASFPHS